MRILIFDITLARKQIEYDYEDIKKFLKEQKSIPLIRYKTTEVTKIEESNKIGDVINISIYNGKMRGDLIIEESKKKEYQKIVEEHLKKDRIHIALKVMGYKLNDKVTVQKVKGVYYLYLKE